MQNLPLAIADSPSADFHSIRRADISVLHDWGNTYNTRNPFIDRSSSDHGRPGKGNPPEQDGCWVDDVECGQIYECIGVVFDLFQRIDIVTWEATARSGVARIVGKDADASSLDLFWKAGIEILNYAIELGDVETMRRAKGV